MHNTTKIHVAETKQFRLTSEGDAECEDEVNVEVLLITQIGLVLKE